jgi:hypothetical protein
MVKVKQPDPYDVLDALIRAACEKHKFKLRVEGWARKTYDVFLERTRERDSRDLHLARIESLATTNGEIRYFDDQALAFCEDLGTELEAAFRFEATLVKDRAPGN